MKNLNSLRKIVFTFLLLPAIIWVGKAQTITGDWNGVLDLEGISLQIVLHIKQVENGFQATMDSPDQNTFDIPLDTLTLESGKLEFIFNSAGAKYAGIFDESFTNIKGTFSQGGQDLPLAFQRGKIKPPENSMTYIKEIYTKKEVYIPMRDGVRLFTSVYTPNDTTQLHPVLMNRTPYNAERSEDGFSFFLLAFIDYVKEGYIFVFQDVRGKYMSEGEFEDVRPYIPDKKTSKDIDESSDTFDSMDWLIKNVPFNNGKIGILGTSYPGFYSTMALPDAHPAPLKKHKSCRPYCWWVV